MKIQEIQTLILVGGLGTRLRSVVQDVPKPMAPIQGKPFLDYLLRFLKKQGLVKIAFLTGYKPEIVSNYFGDGSSRGLQIQYSIEASPLGTGGAIVKAMRAIPAREYLVLNGDSFFNIDLNRFLQKTKSPVTIALKKMNNIDRYGAVETSNGTVVKFREKTGKAEPGLINSGVYYLTPAILSYCTQEVFSLEKDLFPQLIAKDLVSGVESEGEFIDIGLPESFQEAQTLLPDWFKNYESEPL
jgi:D-glycero-alpha-D-manno-heptose 1-phosphate guanylyltransferase